MSLEVYNVEKQKVGQFTTSEYLNSLELDAALIQRAVMYNMVQRKGAFRFASTKNLSEVSGTGKKPWKQKGTGNARQGTLRGPHFRGGCVVMGPRPHNISYKMNKKAWRKAVLTALKDKLESNNLIVLEKFDFKTCKTKELKEFLTKFEVKDALLVTDGFNRESNIYKSSANLMNVKLLPHSALNVLDVLTYTNMIIEKDALKKILDMVGN